jgi:hypothetical protein
VSPLPVPVARFVELATASHPGAIDTVILETTAWMRRPRLPAIPLEIRMSHQLGRAFVHEIRVGRGRLSVGFGLDAFVDGHGLMKVGPALQTGPAFDQGALIAMWGEALTFPTSWLGRRDVRWEGIDGRTALLVVPNGDREVPITVTFDPESGWPACCEADRYKTPDALVHWFGSWSDWRVDTAGLATPHRFLVRWADEAGPWLDVRLGSLRANVPVEHAFEVARRALGAGTGPSTRRGREAREADRPPMG